MITFDGAQFFTKIAGSTLPWRRACMWENSFEQIFYWRINAPPNLNGHLSQPPHFGWFCRSAGLWDATTWHSSHTELFWLQGWLLCSLPLALFFSPLLSSCICECFPPLMKSIAPKMWLTVIFRYRYWLSFAKETQHARTDKYKNNTKGYIYSSETVLMTTSAPLIWGWLGSSPLFWFAHVCLPLQWNLFVLCLINK